MLTSILRRLFSAALQYMEFYDAPTREFEHVNFTFEIVLSSSAYAQVKRHRISSQSVQGYDVNLGVTVPPAVREAGLEDEFMKHLARAEELYHKVHVEMPEVAPYVLTNAHRRRVIMTINLRELYHFARLREDGHAQWDIRDIAFGIRQEVSREMPMGSMLLCGKDSYPELYEKLFDRPVTIRPPVG